MMLLTTQIIIVVINIAASKVFQLAPLHHVETRAADYCAVANDHTMCKYKGPSAMCSAETICRVFSEVGQQEIVDRHNELRRKIAKGEQEGLPPAADMYQVSWSDELATIAQRWADQCKFKHDKHRETLAGEYVGQNARLEELSQDVAVEEKINQEAADSVQSWYDEVVSPGFKPANINPFKMVEGTGHFSQTIWAKTRLVGCGYVHYKEGSWYSTLTFCNYSPGGNYLKQSLHTQGEACTHCQEGDTCQDGLCVSKQNK